MISKLKKKQNPNQIYNRFKSLGRILKQAFSHTSIKNFFLWWAAVENPKLMPSIHKGTYFSLGVLAFVITLLAFLAAFYTGYTNGNIFTGLLAGSIAATFVFAVDRFILTSESKEDESKEKRKKLLFRLVLSFCTALIITTPAETAMFSSSIRVQKMQEISAEIAVLQNQYDATRNKRYSLDPSTGKKIENEDIMENAKRIDAQIKDKQQRLNKLSSGVNNIDEMAFIEQVLSNWKSSLTNPYHAIVHFGIFGLFLFVDIIPALLKSTKKYDRYDINRAKKAEYEMAEIDIEIKNNHDVRVQEIIKDRKRRLASLGLASVEEKAESSVLVEQSPQQSSYQPISTNGKHQSSNKNYNGFKNDEEILPFW